MKQLILKALGFACLFLLTSCERKSNEPQTQTRSNSDTIQELCITLDGVLTLNDEELINEEEIRSFAFTNTTKDGTRLQMTEKNISSILIISNKAKNKVYYLQAEWRKTKGKNHLSISGLSITKDLYNQNINIQANEEWYMTGFIGGTLDKANKKVQFNPNEEKLFATGTSATIRSVPVYFPWIKLNITKQKNGIIDIKTSKDAIKFKTLGMMIALEVSSQFDENVRVKNLYIESNALSTTKGYYDLSITSLPATSDIITLPTWIRDGDNEPRYKLHQSNGKSLQLDLKPQQTYSSKFLLWAMPNKATPATPITHVMAHAVRLKNGIEQNYPRMESLYIWGSNKMPRERTRRLFKASIYRPHMPIEYFATKYIGQDGWGIDLLDQAQPTTPTPEQPNAKGLLFGLNALERADALKSPWSVPRFGQSHGLLPQPRSTTGISKSTMYLDEDYPDFKIIYPNVPVRDTSGEFTQTTSYEPYPQNSEALMYAYTFENYKGNNNLLSAMRVRLTENKDMEIKSIYLGPHYKGSITEIAQSNFWEQHKGQEVERLYVNSIRYYRSPNAKLYAPTDFVQAPNFAVAKRYANPITPNNDPRARYIGTLQRTFMNNGNRSRWGGYGAGALGDNRDLLSHIIPFYNGALGWDTPL